jgi:hypothetical protein
MKRRARWFLIISLAIFSSVLISAGLTHAYVYGRAGPGPSYPADGTVTFIAFLTRGGWDNQILTEDNYNCSLGLDQGYNLQYFWVETTSFTTPTVADGDTMVVLFTGIGAELGNSGTIADTVDTDQGFQDFGNSTWGASSNPAVPTNLQANNVSPGVVDLSWDSPKKAITYRIYRSSQASGAANGASDGAYAKIAQDVAATAYRDSTAPLNMCWYIVVADDGSNLSGHSDEASIDAALPVHLTSFTATGAQDKVVLEWTTETEWDNQGFHIYRREDSSQAFLRITQELIPGAGNSVESQIYSWEDRRVKVGQLYWYQLESVDFQGATQTYGPVSASPVDALPITPRLGQNYPNPFNPQTWISYQLSQPGSVTIKIFNVRGQLVRILVDAEQTPGYYRVPWSGQDLHGAPAASGVYFCQMKSDSFVETIKMILLR